MKNTHQIFIQNAEFTQLQLRRFGLYSYILVSLIFAPQIPSSFYTSVFIFNVSYSGRDDSIYVDPSARRGRRVGYSAEDILTIVKTADSTDKLWRKEKNPALSKRPSLKNT